MLFCGAAAWGDEPSQLGFCEDATQCADGEACVGGRCQPQSDTRIRVLFPIGIDRVQDLTTGARRGPVPDRIDALLRRYLELVGFFTVIPADRNPLGAPFEGHRITTIDFQSWHDAGAYAFVKGTASRNGNGQLEVALRLYLAEEGVEQELPMSTFAVPENDPAAFKARIIEWIDGLLVTYTGRGSAFRGRIAFCKRLDPMGPKEIWVMDADGEHETQVTKNGAINLLPAWTRDGRIAYTSYAKNNPDLWIGDQVFSNRPQLNSGASWHPDGTQVALTLSKDGNAEIYVLEALTGGIRRRLTQNTVIDTSPVWSPDGKRLVFVSDRDTGYPGLYVMQADGTGVQRLPQAGGYNSAPDWSPDGDHIAYATMVGGDRFDIFVITLSTKSVTRLTSGGTGEDPSYSPDGRYITYASAVKGKRQLFIMTADGRYKRQLSQSPGEFFQPAWQR